MVSSAEKFQGGFFTATPADSYQLLYDFCDVVARTLGCVHETRKQKQVASAVKEFATAALMFRVGAP